MSKLEYRKKGEGIEGLSFRDNNSRPTQNSRDCSNNNGMGREVVKAGLGLLLSGGDVTGAFTGLVVGAAVDKIMQ